MRKNMHEQIASCFMKLVSESKYGKRITVVDVANAVGIDRKTFYSYFENTDDVVHWIYRTYLESMVKRPEYVHDELVAPSPPYADNYHDMPFYARRVNGSSLEQGQYFEEMYPHFETNRAYYSHILRDDSPWKFYYYVVSLFCPTIIEDIKLMLGDRELPEVPLVFLAEYHTMGVFGRLQFHFAQTRKFIGQEDLKPYWNYMHETIERDIDRLFVERERGRLASMVLPKSKDFEYLYSAKAKKRQQKLAPPPA